MDFNLFFVFAIYLIVLVIAFFIIKLVLSRLYLINLNKENNLKLKKALYKEKNQLNLNDQKIALLESFQKKVPNKKFRIINELILLQKMYLELEDK